MELITSIQKRVFSTLVPDKIVGLFRLGEGAPPTLGVGIGEVVDGFYSFLGFTRLMTSDVIRKAVARGSKKDTSGMPPARSRDSLPKASTRSHQTRYGSRLPSPRTRSISTPDS